MQTETGRVIACAIVKNEPRLTETIASVRAALGDACAGVFIHDTGSAPEFAAGLRGADWIRSRPFDNFAAARNACLDDAETAARTVGAEWLFMFSGDAVLSGTWSPPPADRHAPALVHSERLGSSTYVKCTTVRVGSGLRYEGVTHEVIQIPGGGVEALPHCGLTVDYTAGFSREKKLAAWRLDLELLKSEYTPRGRYYLAQTYDCLHMFPEAFCMYAVRLEMHGYEPERRQAAANAVRTAPTLALAMWAADQCVSAEAEFELAKRYKREGKPDAAKNRARLALDAVLAGERSLFQETDLVRDCKDILES